MSEESAERSVWEADNARLEAEIERLKALCQEAVVCMRCCNGDKTPEVLSMMRRLSAAAEKGGE